MKVSCPEYFKTFSCLAGSCPDSCCKEWSVCVDEETAAFYRGLPGDLGDRLRQVLAEEDGETVLAIEDGRCPMWRTDGLCRIQHQLGAQALCKTCREFPRISHDFGDFVEWQLELSCPEAARLILEDAAGLRQEWEEPGGSCPEYEPQEMELALRSRQQALALLADREKPPEQVLLELLAMAGPEPGFRGTLEELKACYGWLEVLTEGWPRLLAQARPGKLHPGTKALARYLIYRYWLRQGELPEKIAFIVAACILVSSLPGDFRENAQLWSKEIENSDCNVDDLMDMTYTTLPLSPEGLRGMLENMIPGLYQNKIM